MVPGQLVNGLWIVLLGWFSIRNASAYDRVTTLQEALLQLVAICHETGLRVDEQTQTLRLLTCTFRNHYTASLFCL